MKKITFLLFAFAPFIGFTQKGTKNITILHTNDFHSAFDPIPAYWLKNSPKLGGAAQLTTMINQIREKEKSSFLFDAGDMYTGMLSNVSEGEILMEMMMSMKYDAMGIGNHEFDYGSKNFSKQMNRVSFPILGDNIFYKGTNIPYSRPYTIIEKNGVRLGVIGIMGSWNFPLLTCLSPLVYAIAAGNTAVIKPSEVSPNSLLILKKLCEAYLDRDSYIMIEG